MVQPSLDPLAGQSFPEVAAALRARHAPILEQWEAVVRQTLPTADELTLVQFRDNTPRVLEQMAEALATTQAAPIDRLMSISSSHGDVRFHQSYNLNEVLIEYHILRRIILQQLAAQLQRDLSADEAVAVNLGVDVATRLAVESFAAHQTRQLNAATEAQSKYLSFLSHDLRGGLNGIFLMIEVLKRELQGHAQFAETMQDLDLMRRSLLETVATMDRFLHAERFRKGKVQVRPGPVNLQHLLGEISAQFAYQAKDKGIDLRVDVPAPAKMTSDRELLSLIFQNLVSNAVKYTPKGTVHIGAKLVPENGWQVEVIDQGPGIAQEKLAELFESFTRGDTHGQPGVGLGLTIAQQAAQLLGAKLWAESAPGRGSTFYVRLNESTTPSGSGSGTATKP